MTPIVTLTTDFGTQDSFVGAMKGVLLSRCPGVQIVDLCHEVRAQDVRGGALRLAAAARYFPAGTVHIAVVDPGVGTERRAIAIRANGSYFIGPDNGLLSLAASPGTAGCSAVALTRPEFWLSTLSNTFHGRDIFAPAAAYVAAGGAMEDLGQPVQDLVALDLPVPHQDQDSISGVVMDLDRFGNLITNVRATDLGQRVVDRVQIGGVVATGLSRFYDPSQRLVALISSEGYLEIAVPGGSAATQLNLSLDAPVDIFLRTVPSN